MSTSNFRCCGLPKNADTTGYRTSVYGKRVPYCRACKNARERRYRKKNRNKMNASVVRQRLRKQEIVVPVRVPIPRSDVLVLAGLQADILAAADDPEGGDIIEQLRQAYLLGAGRLMRR